MNFKRFARGLAGIFLLGLFVLFLASPARAVEPMSGERLVIEEGQVIEDDLYAGANIVILKGTIKGDLVAAGSVVLIEPSGVVEGDVLVAAQGVVIDGAVRGDVRAGAAVVSVGQNAEIGEDLLAFGYSVELKTGAKVGGDLVAYGAQAGLAGQVGGDAWVGAQGVQISGQVGGNVDAEVGSEQETAPFNPLMFMPQVEGMPAVLTVPSGLTIGPEAQIAGNLNYTATKDANIPADVVGGQTTRREPQVPPEQAPPTSAEKALAWFWKLLRSLATLLVVGFLMAWLAPGFVRKGVTALQARPLDSLLWGVVAYVAFFIALMLILIVIVIAVFILGLVTLGDLVTTSMTVGTVVVSSLLLIFKVAASYASKILVSVLVGGLLLARLKPGLEGNRFWPMILGVVLFVLLWSIPILGMIVNIVVILLGLGAQWLVGRDWFMAWRAKEAPPVPAD
ncbi:MAG: polymer-forming cytoskeletal protein [Anaerolineales bacterium]|nr:polymer-forming cytoskeletal protein [Anaerolineales bacterium]